MKENKKNYTNSLTEKLFKKFISEWLIISILAALLITTYASSSWHRYGYIIYDAFIKLAAKNDSFDKDIIIIAIDEKSISALGRWPWSRDRHIQLINSLQSSQPEALGFNLLFTEASENKSSDLNFKKSIKESAFPIILPIFKNTQQQDFFFSTPNTLLSSIDFTADPDGVIRRLKLIDQHYDSFLPQLSLQAYWAANNKTFKPELIYDNILINFKYKSSAGFKKISYIDVLRGNYIKDDFFGKIVLVGVTATGLYNMFSTPADIYQNSISIHAQILDNIIDSEFIFELDALKKLYISFLISILYLTTVYTIKKYHIYYTAIAFSISTLLFSAILLANHIWWSPLSCIIFFITSCFIWSWRRSSAIISWCRYSVNYFQPEKNNSLIKIKKNNDYLFIKDRFQFELKSLEDMLVTAKGIENKKTRLRTYLSHDLRSPNASMAALIKSQRNPKTALPASDFNLMLERLIDKNLSLLDDLLILSRSDTQFLKLEPVLLAAIIQDALDFLWPQFIANKVQVNFDSEELGEILGDAKLLLRAFSNILENSIKYAGQHAQVNIDIIKIGNKIILKIADDGPDFKCQEKENQTTTSNLAHSSYGLGLELVSTVIKAHNATLSSQISDGNGAVFVFEFSALEPIEV